MIQIAGGVVWNPKLGIVVVSQNSNSWSLPKGHVEEGEEHFAGAIREIHEETGIPPEELTYIRKLITYERNRIARRATDTTEPREITLYLFTTDHETLSPLDPVNPEARWVPIDEVALFLTHPKDKEVFELLKEKIVL